MKCEYDINDVWGELVKRFTDDALKLIIDMEKSNKKTLTWSGFWEKFNSTWNKKYPNKSMFLSGYIHKK